MKNLRVGQIKVDFIRVIYHTGENIRNGVKACLQVPSPSLCPSPFKFNTVPMETDRLMGRSVTEPILSVKRPVTIHIM